jgi:hypothetical protein
LDSIVTGIVELQDLTVENHVIGILVIIGIKALTRLPLYLQKKIFKSLPWVL